MLLDVRSDLSAVYTIEWPAGNPPVHNDFHIVKILNRFRVAINEMAQLAIDHQVFVAIILRDGKPELAVWARRERSY